MIVASLKGVPTAATLSQAFGFPAPKAFVDFMSKIYEASDGDWTEAGELFARAIGKDFVDATRRYQMTPPELCPFASIGCDGDHDGYVIHAPELASDDYPVGAYCPMDSVGVWLIGRNTQEAMECYLCESLQYAMEFGGEYYVDRPRTEAAVGCLSGALGLHPTAEGARRFADAVGNGLPVVPPVPEGWRFVASSDGIGVLAPADAFGAAPINTHPMNPKEAIAIADGAFAENRPAAALYYLREAFWKTRGQEGICRRLIDVYEALNRPLFADVVRQKLAYLRVS